MQPYKDFYTQPVTANWKEGEYNVLITQQTAEVFPFRGLQSHTYLLFGGCYVVSFVLVTFLLFYNLTHLCRMSPWLHMHISKASGVTKLQG